MKPEIGWTGRYRSLTAFMKYRRNFRASARILTLVRDCRKSGIVTQLPVVIQMWLISYLAERSIRGQVWLS